MERITWSSRTEKLFSGMVAAIVAEFMAALTIVTLIFADKLNSGWGVLLVFLAVYFGMSAILSIKHAWWCWKSDINEYEFVSGYNLRVDDYNFYHMLKKADGWTSAKDKVVD